MGSDYYGLPICFGSVRQSKHQCYISVRSFAHVQQGHLQRSGTTPFDFRLRVSIIRPLQID